MQIRSTSTVGILLCCALVYAGDAPQGLTIDEAWIREGPPNAMALAGYIVIENQGSTARHLVGAASPAFGRIELHRSVHEGGVAKMVPQETMPIPAKGKLELKPGDYHLMMLKPARPLRAGDQVLVTLNLDNEEQASVTFRVKKATGDGHAHHYHH